MPSILEEFAYGTVPSQVQSLNQSTKYIKAMKLAQRIKQELLDRLGDDEKDLLERFVEAQCEAHQLSVVKNLVHGYKLGLVMTAEAFVGKDDLYVGGEEI